MSESQITMDDFFPLGRVVADDFYPDGPERFFKRAEHVREVKRRINSDAAAVLEALTKRVMDAADAEIEFVTIMEFCENILRLQGVDFEKYRARFREAQKAERSPALRESK